MKTVYVASPIKRHRGTADEMETRALFLIAYAVENSPVTVRQLFYAATVANMPGIEKNELGYSKIQRQVLSLRRANRLPYSAIADSTRWMRRPRMHNGIAQALADTAEFYRRNLWSDADEMVEIWVEKDALAGVIYPVTAEYGVPLMVCKGFSSETFAYEAAAAYAADGRPVHVYHFGDFDRSGVDAANDLERKLTGFAAESGVEVNFYRVAVTPEQIEALGLPTRAPKRNSPADRKWAYDYAAELDAMPPAFLRSLVRAVLSQHMPDEKIKATLAAEASERNLLFQLAREAA